MVYFKGTISSLGYRNCLSLELIEAVLAFQPVGPHFGLVAVAALSGHVGLVGLAAESRSRMCRESRPAVSKVPRQEPQ